MLALSPQLFVWVGLCLGIVLIIFRLGFVKHRSLSSLALHAGILLTGSAIGNSWLGILFISVPFLLIYYYAMYQFAQVIIPFANPDDKKEAKKHFWVLFWYSWGFQYPFWVVTDHAGRQIEQRISGKFIKPYGAPGMICADSHHAIGITAGYEFSRVA